MKLAEALLLRADRKRAHDQLRARAQGAARFQEGEPPAEAAYDLLSRADRMLEQLEALIRQINLTNARTTLPSGRTMTAALAERDVLTLRHALYTAVADAGSGSLGPGLHGHMERQMRSELRYVTDLPVAELRRTADQIAERRRLLDTEIQAANWATDLLEERPTGSDSR